MVARGEPPAGSSVTATASIEAPAGTRSTARSRPAASGAKVPRLCGAPRPAIPQSW